MSNFFRKIFIFFALALLQWISIDASAAAEESHYPHGDGFIRLFNYHLNEFAKIQFKKGNQVLPEGLKKIQHLLRSRDNSELTQIDTCLLDLMDHLQDHFAADTIEIISGYRRKELNDALLQNGRAVSPVSLHTRGQAIDIHIDEIKEETLRDYLLSLKLGGVGYYGPLDFIHIDTGPVRQWGDRSASRRKLVGVLESKAAVQLISDKNDYLPGETLFFTWNFPKKNSLDQIQAIRLERFWRGNWMPCSIAIAKDKLPSFGLPTSRLSCEQVSSGNSYGKYRWTFKVAGNDRLHSSNEFYLKRE